MTNKSTCIILWRSFTYIRIMAIIQVAKSHTGTLIHWKFNSCLIMLLCCCHMEHITNVIICPTAIAQIMKSLASFCLSVCLSTLSSNFCSILMKFYTAFLNPKSKNAFIRDQSQMTSSLFCPNFPTMHFRWEGPNTAVMSPVGQLWQLRA